MMIRKTADSDSVMKQAPHLGMTSRASKWAVEASPNFNERGSRKATVGPTKRTRDLRSLVNLIDALILDVVSALANVLKFRIHSRLSER